MTNSDPEQLLERLRDRDERALADLYDEMGGRAYGLAYQVLRDGAAAEDAVQAAFTMIWEQGDRLDPGRGSVQGLLLTIVHRRAIDAARARQRHDSRNGQLIVDPVDEAETTLDGPDILGQTRGEVAVMCHCQPRAVERPERGLEGLARG